MFLALSPLFTPRFTAAHRNRSDLILDALRLQGNEILVRRRAKLHEFIDGYVACTESLNALADDLMDMYPDAKLILNVRPPPRSGESAAIAWAQSCNETVSFFGSFWGLAACWPLRQYCFWWYR